MFQALTKFYFDPRFNWFDICYFIAVGFLCTQTWWWLCLILPLVIASTIMETVTR